MHHDEYGYTWITCHQSTVDLPALMTQLHAVNATLADTGFGPSLLCTVVGFTAPSPAPASRLGLVYLFKRGTVYPFAPLDGQRRDTALEMRVRSALAENSLSKPTSNAGSPFGTLPCPRHTNAARSDRFATPPTRPAR